MTLAALLKRPYILINVSERPDAGEAAGEILKFIEGNKVETLNVAGPSLSGWPDGYRSFAAIVDVIIELRNGLRLDDATDESPKGQVTAIRSNDRTERGESMGSDAFARQAWAPWAP